MAEEKKGSIFDIIIYKPDGSRDYEAENREYWLQRSKVEFGVLDRATDKYADEMKREYLDAVSQIKKEINSFYSKYAGKKGVDLTQARLILDEYELKEFRATADKLLKRYKTTANLSEYRNKIKALRTRKRIERLEVLAFNIEQKIVELGVYEQEELEALMREAYGIGWQSTKEGIEKAGIGRKTLGSTINEKALKSALSYEYQGSMFSDDIWDDKSALLKSLNFQVRQGLILGRNPRETGAEIEKKLGKGLSNAVRLARTETNFMLNRSHLDTYQEAGLKRFEFSGHLDSKISKQCFEMDGQIILISEAQVGLNVPPLHPNCRSTIIPYVEPRELKKLDDKANINKPATIIDKTGNEIDYTRNATSIQQVDRGRLTSKVDRAREQEKYLLDYRGQKGSLKRRLKDGRISQQEFDKEMARVEEVHSRHKLEVGEEVLNTSIGDILKEDFQDFQVKQEAVGGLEKYREKLGSPSVTRDKDYYKSEEMKKWYSSKIVPRGMKDAEFNALLDKAQETVNYAHSNSKIQYIHNKIGDDLTEVVVSKTNYAGEYVTGRGISLDMDTLLEKIAYTNGTKAVKVGGVAVGQTPAQIYAHEYGHFVDYSLRKRKINFWDEYSKRGKYQVANVKKNLSKYADTNEEERFAEFFALSVDESYSKDMLKDPWVDDARRVLLEIIDEVF